jgi:hypothetical protein
MPTGTYSKCFTFQWVREYLVPVKQFYNFL